ncbi:helix-turn-helix transcriptional regulator [Rhodococcus sp. BGS-1C]|jgi:DNA-binding HxlR family transcriptional regulator|uniref:winged helix-turn-helix transcriptional regulator n=1 Tax=unclassified Rhodococcus (in: high G+C Gram-positive bacteria) TaxID=192944 RepID=UPI0019D049B1|nr:helix-turn-helix domain-containing protein [Rhodococcus sp. KRD197]
MTAEQSREQAKKQYSVYLENCPAHQLLETLSNKWVALVLCALGEGAHRHSELRRVIAGVSQKMLTATLRSLERDGIIVRDVIPGFPRHVEYRLTPLGASLLPVVYGMKEWAENHMSEVLAHRESLASPVAASPVAASPVVASTV